MYWWQILYRHWIQRHLWEIHSTESCCFSWLCQRYTNNTKAAGIILVGKQCCSHKKAIFHEKIFNFAQNHFDFLSSKWSRHQPSCWLGKLFQLCFVVAKSQMDKGLLKGKLKAKYRLSAVLWAPLLRSVQQSTPRYMLLSDQKNPTETSEPSLLFFPVLKAIAHFLGSPAVAHFPLPSATCHHAYGIIQLS